MTVTTIPCGRITGKGIGCVEGNLCDACAEITRLRDVQDQLKAALEMARTFVPHTRPAALMVIDAALAEAKQ